MTQTIPTDNNVCRFFGSNGRNHMVVFRHSDADMTDDMLGIVPLGDFTEFGLRDGVDYIYKHKRNSHYFVEEGDYGEIVDIVAVSTEFLFGDGHGDVAIRHEDAVRLRWLAEQTAAGVEKLHASADGMSMDDVKSDLAVVYSNACSILRRFSEGVN